jgi:hypothetical protein
MTILQKILASNYIKWFTRKKRKKKEERQKNDKKYIGKTQNESLEVGPDV